MNKSRHRLVRAALPTTMLLLPTLLPLLALLLVLSPKAAHADEKYIFSPDRKHKASYSQGKVSVRDPQDKLISEFIAKDSDGPNTGITDLYWIDKDRLAIQLHMNPSMDYLSLTDVHGNEIHSYLGYNFSWSHSRKAVAHVGHMIHFTDWPHSEYIQVNDSTVYPLSGPAYGKDAKAVHNFIPTFAWSSDDSKLALIDEVEGEGAGKFLVIIPVNSPEQSRQFKILPQQSASINTLYPKGVKINWQGNTSVTVSTVNGEKSKDLPFTIGITKTWEPSPGHVQIPIWPGKPPDALPTKGPEFISKPEILNNVSKPTITVYSPDTSKNTGIAVVVIPGGGYKILAMDLEGTEICDWLTSKGITAILLKYRVPSAKLYPARGSIQALEDLQRAMGLVRSRAAEWHIDPHKIGVLGFSAGGHLAAWISNSYEKRAYKPVDSIDKVSCRPDFAAPIYPGHLWIDRNKFELNSDIHVTSKTPPTFLLQNEDDRVDPVEHSLVYYRALRAAGVPVEMHLYAQGGHAFGLRPSKLPVSKWPQLFETWLKTIGMI